MKVGISLILSILLAQVTPQKNDPKGIWKAETGTKFELQPSDYGVDVHLVPGSNPRYLKYELQLKKTDEVNTYEGAGYFVAKLQNGKECRFDAEWQIVVVQPALIAAIVPNIVPDPETCAVKRAIRRSLNSKKSS